MSARLFISYRRQDSAASAGRLYDFLESKVGREALFKDVDTLPYGRDFREEIRRAIDSSQLVLVVIGRDFITPEKRLFDPQDYVRYEIAYALARGKTVIPVRVDEARMPAPDDLPEEIRRLCTLHGPELRHARWKTDCTDLWQKIEPFLRETPLSLSVSSIVSPNEFVDPRDGQVYRTTELNGKLWLAENLNFNVGEGCCFYDDDPKNGEQYGRLYTWEAARRACPLGWTLPGKEDIDEIIDHFGGSENTYRALIQGGNTGFDALLGGSRDPNGVFFNLGRYGYYWSDTEHNSDGAWPYWFSSDDQRVGRYSVHKVNVFSCRCLRTI